MLEFIEGLKRWAMVNVSREYQFSQLPGAVHQDFGSSQRCNISDDVQQFSHQEKNWLVDCGRGNDERKTPIEPSG